MLFTTTLADYRNFIKRELGINESEDNLEWPDSLIDDKINFGRKTFFGRMQYHNRKGIAYVNSVANIAAVSIPETIATISHVRYYNGTKYQLLKYIPEDVYLRRTYIAQTGTPIEWTRRGGSIYLYPAPASSVTNAVEFYGSLNITKLESDTDTDNNIEDRYFEIVCDFAIAECWAHAEQHNNATPRYAKFEKFFADNAFEINSDQTGQDVSTYNPPGIFDETDPRRLGHLT